MVTAPTPEEAARRRAGIRDYTCGLCDEEFGSNCSPGDIECANCEARLCPSCGTWFTENGDISQEPDDSPVCPRDHWQWGRDMPMDRVLAAEGGWECPGIRPDRSGGCGFRIEPAPGLAADMAALATEMHRRADEPSPPDAVDVADRIARAQVLHEYAARIRQALERAGLLGAS